MKHLVVLSFLVLSFTSSAFKWGGYLGGTYSLADTDGINEIDTSAELGRDIAFAIKQKLLGPLSVELQLGYKTHSSGLTLAGTRANGSAGTADIDLNYEYLYLRPLVHYSLNKRFSLIGGLMLANTVSAERELKFSDVTDFTGQASKTSIRTASKDFRVAINIGVEMKVIDLGIVDLALRLSYEQAFTDASDDSSGDVSLNSLNLGAVAFF